jgi:NAD(P)-dependent dehydrogenase (short-subunit alcohol dehydrogenase family)
MSGRLAGKVAVVTGAAQGIGVEYAKGLAAEGAAIAAADRNEAGAKDTAAAIVAAGGRAVAVAVDVSDEASNAEMAERVVTELGGIDILVNNAAVYAGLQRRPPFEIPVEEWDRVMAVNLRGPWLCAKAVVPSMQARGGGRIVNQSSVGAWMGGSLLHYAVSKAGLIGLTRGLARAFGGDGITVNTIAPGRAGARGAARADEPSASRAPHRHARRPDRCAGVPV